MSFNFMAIVTISSEFEAQENSMISLALSCIIKYICMSMFISGNMYQKLSCDKIIYIFFIISIILFPDFHMYFLIDVIIF